NNSRPEPRTRNCKPLLNTLSASTIRIERCFNAERQSCWPPRARPYPAAAALIVPSQSPAAGLGSARKGEKLTLVVTASPLPGPTPDGPSPAPHQLSVALTTPLVPSTSIPKDALPSMLLLCASAPVLLEMTLMPMPRIEPALTVSRTMLGAITTPALPRSE